MGKIITFSANKGGVGKTNAATNISALFAKLYSDKKVCLIDLDGQCGVSNDFNLKISHNQKTARSIFSLISGKDVKLKDILVNNIKDQEGNVLENFSIIPAEAELLKIVDYKDEYKEEMVENLVKTISALKEHFDYLFIDTHPDVNVINTTIFGLSDLIVSPLNADRKSVRGMLSVLRSFKNMERVPKIYVLPYKWKANQSSEKEILNTLNEWIVDYKEEVPEIGNNVIISDVFIPEQLKYKAIPQKFDIPLTLASIYKKPKKSAPDVRNIDEPIKKQIDLMSSIVSEINDLLD